MAASDHVPVFFKNRLHLAGRPQMGTTCQAGKLQSSGRCQGVSLAGLRSSRVTNGCALECGVGASQLRSGAAGGQARRVRSYGLSRIRRAAACQLDGAAVMDFRPAKDRNLLRDLKPLRPLRENVLGPLASVRSANATI